jgi:hypothetical protein
MQVSVKDPQSNREITVEYEFGSNLEDATAKFGEETIFASAIADLKVGLQAFVRTRLRKAEDEYMDDATIIAEAANWTPGAKRAAADPMAKLTALLSKLSPEQRAALLEGALG